MLQPEQASLADNYYFLEKQSAPDEPEPMPTYQPLRQKELPEAEAQNPFRLRSKSPEAEILPQTATLKPQEPERPLKLVIPKGILKSTLDLREQMSLYNKQGGDDPEGTFMRHVNFDSNVIEENFRSVETIETSADIERQPPQISHVLKRFLKGTWDENEAQDDFLADQMLISFPVFALNDDYLRALANVVYSKVEAVRNMIGHKERQVREVEAERERRLRDKSLSLLKSKMEQRDNS
jgi:hypothetical protein